MNNEISAQWKILCRDFEYAKGVYFNTLAPVIKNFRSVYEGTGANPTEDQLISMENAWEKWQETQQKMNVFVSNNT